MVEVVVVKAAAAEEEEEGDVVSLFVLSSELFPKATQMISGVRIICVFFFFW